MRPLLQLAGGSESYVALTHSSAAGSIELPLASCFNGGAMQKVWCWLGWQLQLQRARMDPARYIDRAASHVEGEWRYERINPGVLLHVAARFVEDGQEVPRWLFRR